MLAIFILLVGGGGGEAGSMPIIKDVTKATVALVKTLVVNPEMPRVLFFAP